SPRPRSIFFFVPSRVDTDAAFPVLSNGTAATFPPLLPGSPLLSCVSGAKNKQSRRKLNWSQTETRGFGTQMSTHPSVFLFSQWAAHLDDMFRMFQSIA